MSTEESTKWGLPADGQEYVLGFNPQVSACETSIQFGKDIPGFYRRTYLLGMALHWPMAAIAGLFDYDTRSWVWSKDKGFKPFIFTKRK